MLARPGTHVDDIVGTADGLLVMFHDEHRVAKVPQVFKRSNQTLVIALMQADGRFIENIEHAHEASTDLRCKADALRLATGKRGGCAFEREVVEPDVD